MRLSIVFFVLLLTSISHAGIKEWRTNRETDGPQNQITTKAQLTFGKWLSGLSVQAPAAQNYQATAYDPIKDCLYRAYLLSTIIGVFGAALGIIFLLRQTKATEELLRLTHRPKVVVRNIVIPELTKLNRRTPMNEFTQKLTGYYTVANTGGIAATINHVIEGTWCEKGLPMERPDRKQPGRKVNIALAPGESKEVDFLSITLSERDATALIFGDSSAYFLVRIRYADEKGFVRETSACRKFDPDAMSFTRVDNPDYEYAD
jgi:hypothetical protein